MPYLVRGNAEQFWLSVQQNHMIDESNGSELITKDLVRTQFLGSILDAKTHVQQWLVEGNDQFYAQGNINAGNLFMFIDPTAPLKKNDEEIQEAIQKTQRIQFAFVNDKGQLCGLSLHYRVDDPTQWIVGLIKDTQKAPKERDIYLLANFDLRPCITNADDGVQIQPVDKIQNELIQQCDSDWVKKLLTYVFNPNLSQSDNHPVHPKVKRLNQLVRYLRIEKGLPIIQDSIDLNELDIKQLLSENPLLDLMQQYDVLLPFKLLKSSFDPNSKIRKELGSVILTNDSDKDTQLLQAYLKLVDKNYDSKMTQSILSEEVYYLSFLQIEALGYAQDFPDFFNQKEKCEQLKNIHQIQNESLKTLCLVFWSKGDLTNEEFEALIDALEGEASLSQTLLYIDKTGEISVNDLYKIAIDRKELLRQTILYQFANEFDKYGLNKQSLLNFNEQELVKLHKSFEMIKSVYFTNPEIYYQLILKNELNGHKLRLFLALFDRAEDSAHLKILIPLLYNGVQYGLINQGEAVKSIKDVQLLKKAERFQERFICVTHLYNLQFKEEVATFSALETEASHRLREVILRVEERVKAIKLRLLDSAPEAEEKKKLVSAIDDYRKTIYAIAFEGLTLDQFDYKKQIQIAEKAILNCVDPEIQSWLKKALVVIANIVITLLTLGIANDIKEQQTGNYWFFNRTQSGEEISVLHQEVNALIESNWEEQQALLLESSLNP